MANFTELFQQLPIGIKQDKKQGIQAYKRKGTAFTDSPSPILFQRY